MRLKLALSIGVLFLCAGALRAEEPWIKQFPEASVRLHKLFETHPKFRDPFTDWFNNHTESAERLTKFLIEKESHTIEEFLKLEEFRKHRDHPYLEKLHKDYTEALLEYRLFVQAHPKAALELVQHPKYLERLDDRLDRKQNR
jgi:hypothetical protein